MTVWIGTNQVLETETQDGRAFPAISCEVADTVVNWTLLSPRPEIDVVVEILY